MQIAKYQIHEELGRGAMGTVYKAWDPLLDRFVAIKLISGAFHDKLKTLFEREAKSIAKMSDPNIITIFDFNYYENQPYIVMELLKGLNLEELTKKTDLELPQKLEIVSQICRGLSHAHEHSIIHRDIKPSNIFLTENGTAKIMDFGIARLTTATQTHALLGTPEYMSPEQILGNPLDGRSDLFSLGTLLYWFLTGNSPFIADGVHPILHNIVNKVPAPVTVSQLNEKQMEELQHILNRSMAKNPDDRYSLASEMQADVDRFLSELKEVGIVESSSLKQRVKSIVLDLEKQKESTRFAGATQLEDFPIDRTLQVPGKKVPTLPPATAENKPETPVVSIHKHSMVLRSIGLIGMVAFIFGAYWIFIRSRTGANLETVATTSPALQTKHAELVIAFGSDKKKWVNNLAADFQKTASGNNVRLKLQTLGYSEATEELLSGKHNIDVWWPSSTLPEKLFLAKWKEKYGSTLHPDKRALALSSMIFLIWEDKYAPFINKYKKLNFRTLHQAMLEKNGWGDIAGKPEWGLFGFGHADPSESNTGLMMLQLLAQEYFEKAGALTESDVQNPGFQQFLKSFHSKAKVLGKTTEESMQEMIMKGPSTYDVAFVSENVAMDFLSEAEGRWEKFHIVYPEYNMWSENPFYISPWVSAEQRKLAQLFLDFVSQNSEQLKALNHGFRPADTTIPLRVPGSPFMRYQDLGLQIQIGTTCEYPTPEALAMLIQSWKS